MNTGNIGPNFLATVDLQELSRKNEGARLALVGGSAVSWLSPEQIQAKQKEGDVVIVDIRGIAEAFLLKMNEASLKGFDLSSESRILQNLQWMNKKILEDSQSKGSSSPEPKPSHPAPHYSIKLYKNHGYSLTFIENDLKRKMQELLTSLPEEEWKRALVNMKASGIDICRLILLDYADHNAFFIRALRHLPLELKTDLLEKNPNMAVIYYQYIPFLQDQGINESSPEPNRVALSEQQWRIFYDLAARSNKKIFEEVQTSPLFRTVIKNHLAAILNKDTLWRNLEQTLLIWEKCPPEFSSEGDFLAALFFIESNHYLMRSGALGEVSTYPNMKKMDSSWTDLPYFIFYTPENGKARYLEKSIEDNRTQVKKILDLQSFEIKEAIEERPPILKRGESSLEEREPKRQKI